MGKSIVLTIARGAAYMEAMGYSEATISRHLKHWRSLDNFAGKGEGTASPTTSSFSLSEKRAFAEVASRKTSAC